LFYNGFSVVCLCTLTTGADTVKGTSANDTFTGYSDTVANGGTYGINDTIDGGLGNDTLNVTLTTAGPATIINNVETINVRTTAAVAFSAAGITGATAFWSDNSTAASTITGIKNAATIGVRGGDGTALASFTLADAVLPNAATAATQNIALDSADITTLQIGTVTAGGNEATTMAFNVTGANRIRTNLVDSTALAATALNAYTTITVEGAGSLRMNEFALAATLKTFDASKNTGGVRADLSATTTAMKFTGGAGADRISLAASLDATDVIIGGEGVDTVGISDPASLTAATGALVTGFENLRIEEGSATAFTVSRIAGLTDITVEATAAAVTTANQKIAQTTTIVGDSGAVAITLGFSDAGVGGSEAHTVVLNAAEAVIAANAGVDLGGALVVTNVDTLTINSIGSVGVAADENSIASLAGNTDLNTATITGDTDLEITDTGAISADGFDASAFTGILQFGGMNLTAAASIKGGTKADALIGSAQGDVITGGAGSDKIVAGGGTDVITGGAGSDIIYLNVLDTNTVAGITDAAITVANILLGDLATPASTAAGGVVTADGVADRVVFDTALSAATNVDTVVGFVTTTDKIVIDDAIFTGLGAGTGSATAGGTAMTRYGEGASLAAAITASGLTSGSAILAVETAAAGANATLTEAKTELYFIADVTAATTTATQFVTLVGTASVAAGDFLVY
jgi:hypothetical protein